MSRRTSPRGWYEEDIYEHDRYSNNGTHDFAVEDDVDRRRRTSHPPVRELDRPRTRDRYISDFIQESYEGGGNPSPMVLKRRDREESEFLPRERLREMDRERDDVSLRGGSERGRRSSGEFERNERKKTRRPVDRDVERDEVFVRRRDRSLPDHENDDRSVKRDRDRSSPSELEQDEMPVRHTDRKDSRNYERERDEFRRATPPRLRSNSRRRSESRSRDEIAIRRDERNGGSKKGDTVDDEIILRKREARSPSSERLPLDPPIRATPTHPDMITYHRHVDYGFDMGRSSHAPSPEIRSPRDSVDELEVHQRGERSGRSYRDDIIVDRREKDKLAPTLRRCSPGPCSREKDEIVAIFHIRPRFRERESDLVIREPDSGGRRRHTIDHRDERDIRKESDYYSRRNSDRGCIGEAYNGATKDWTIVDVPPGTKRVTFDCIGGPSQEICWQRHNGVLRSSFVTEGDDSSSSDNGNNREFGRIGRRYIGVKEKRDKLWTEITKDLVVREAIERAGYEYEETEYFYYIFEYLRYEDVAALVELSEKIRSARRERIHEIHRERVTSLPALPPVPILPPAPRPPTRLVERSPTPRSWDDERIREHELLLEDRRRPPSRGFW